MRRFLVWTLAASAILSAGGQQALAKGAPGEEQDPMMGAVPTMASAPRDMKPGNPWNASIVFAKDGAPYEAQGFRPIVILYDINTGDAVSVSAFATKHPGFYTARIVFPHAGRWTITVRSLATGVARAFPTIRVGSAATSIPGSNPFPVWVMSGLLSLLLAMGAFLVLPRLRRRQTAVIG